jgi:shikimate kinase / 3-dehydroquinate synthase
LAYVLIGFMGAGKSTAARELSNLLDVECLDSDQLLAERFGHPVAREFELHGEASFREQEEELVCALLGNAPQQAVIALGGGSVLSKRVRGALEDHLTILLEIDADVAWARVQGEQGAPQRPLAGNQEAFRKLHGERVELYESLADAILPSLYSSSFEGVSRALRALAAAPEGTRLLWAGSDSGEYPVLIGRGLLAGNLPEAIWPLDRKASRAFLISDEHVAALHAGHLGAVAEVITIPPGEGSKTLTEAERVWRGLLAGGMTRADHILALGGGVVGDLAGFCAATYQRGVAVVHVPTTLLAQVDSAYGGKTGIDLPEAKNYVGAYHQPAGVIVDPDVLATLPQGELDAGWVEVLKTALIAGGKLWEAVGAGAVADERTIFACARTKLQTVAADERDGGRRQALNLGHTVGHAIETVTGYTRFRHGEAVGLGLLAALRLSGQEQLRAQVSQLLAEHDLPVKLEDVDMEAILEAIGRDKKRLGADVPFVLVRAPGDVSFGCEVPAGELRAAVEELAA